MKYEKNVFGPAVAEREIEVTKALIDLSNANSPAGVTKSKRHMTIAFDEWNIWDEGKTPQGGGLEQPYDYSDGLAMAAWLNVLVRQHKDLGLACLAQTVNAISPVMTSPDGILLQATYFPLRLFSKYMKNGKLLQLPSMPDRYLGPTLPGIIQELDMCPAYIDTCAVLAETQGGSSIRISVLNRHPTASWEANLEIRGFRACHRTTWNRRVLISFRSQVRRGA